MIDDDPHDHGHRQRLRNRFLKSGLAGFADDEVVELLLTLGIPRPDVKQPAKVLTRANVLGAETVHLKVVDHLIVSAQGTFSFRKAGREAALA